MSRPRSDTAEEKGVISEFAGEGHPKLAALLTPNRLLETKVDEM